MSDPISSLKGLEADVKAKLEAQGIKNTQQLLEHTQTTKQRTELNASILSLRIHHS